LLHFIIIKCNLFWKKEKKKKTKRMYLVATKKTFGVVAAQLWVKEIKRGEGIK
jgi:hypothetical protein